jgi:hypothetical protein
MQQAASGIKVQVLPRSSNSRSSSREMVMRVVT